MTFSEVLTAPLPGKSQVFLRLLILLELTQQLAERVKSIQLQLTIDINRILAKSVCQFHQLSSRDLRVISVPVEQRQVESNNVRTHILVGDILLLGDFQKLLKQALGLVEPFLVQAHQG